MAKEKVNLNDALKSAGVGAALIGNTGITIDYVREAKKFSEAKKVSKDNFSKFQRSLRPGDIILEADPEKELSEVLRVRDLDSNTKFNKSLVKVAGNAKVTYSDLIQVGGGGNRYTHTAIYLGKGKVAEMSEGVSKISDIGWLRKKKASFISMRVNDSVEIGEKIASSAREIASNKTYGYKKKSDLIKDAFVRNLTFSGGKFSGEITCTEFVNESVAGAKGKPLINKFNVDPTDIFLAKDAKVKSAYRYTAGNSRTKMLNFVGKNFRGGKFVIMGAGVGASSYLANYFYSKYKKENGGKLTSSQEGIVKKIDSRVSYSAAKASGKFKNGKWITIKGRRIFIKNKGKK